MFESLDEIRARKTMEEYRKNGVTIQLMGNKKIYPQGPIWLPTNQDYLSLFNDYLNSETNLQPNSILELGCGSGVLSFLLSRRFKASNIWAIDSNPKAV